jgi:hypothetical protein
VIQQREKNNEETRCLVILRKYVEDPSSVPYIEVRQAIAYFRQRKKPSFIPEEQWSLMLTW